MNTDLININDVTDPIPTVHSANVEEAVDVSKIDRATIKQLRKNVERLKTMQNVDALKNTPYFDIRSFFPIGRK